MKRLLLIGGLIAAAAYLKSLLEESDRAPAPADTTPYRSTAPPQSGAPERRAGNGAPQTSKKELYRRAQELKIPGRSKMSKAELERAIEEAG